MPVFCDIDGCLKGLMSLLKMFSIFKKGVGINVTFYCIMLRGWSKVSVISRISELIVFCLLSIRCQ